MVRQPCVSYSERHQIRSLFQAWDTRSVASPSAWKLWWTYLCDWSYHGRSLDLCLLFNQWSIDAWKLCRLVSISFAHNETIWYHETRLILVDGLVPYSTDYICLRISCTPQFRISFARHLTNSCFQMYTNLTTNQLRFSRTICICTHRDQRGQLWQIGVLTIEMHRDKRCI